MTAIDTHRAAFKWASDLLEYTMASLTAEQTHEIPPGTANPISATYAHAICSTDGILHGLLQGGAPMLAGAWANRTGVSEPRMDQTLEWSRSVRVDLDAARPYAQAIYAAVDSYIASLAEDDLQREVDLTAVNLGVRSLDWCLSALITGHLHNLTGEISALKGTQGLQGYPF